MHQLSILSLIHAALKASKHVSNISVDGDNDSGEIIFDYEEDGVKGTYILRARDIEPFTDEDEPMLAIGTKVVLTTGEDGEIEAAYEHDRTYDVLVYAGNRNREFTKRGVREDDIDEWFDPEPEDAELSTDMIRFLEWEINNEAAGGESPSTLDSANGSLAQAPDDVLREVGITDPTTLRQEMAALLQRFAGTTELAAFFAND
jgi:hypothetical protein